MLVLRQLPLIAVCTSTVVDSAQLPSITRTSTTNSVSFSASLPNTTSATSTRTNPYKKNAEDHQVPNSCHETTTDYWNTVCLDLKNNNSAIRFTEEEREVISTAICNSKDSVVILTKKDFWRATIITGKFVMITND